MSTFARVQDGVVMELVTVPPGRRLRDLYTPELTAQFIGVPAAEVGLVAAGWRYDGAAFSRPQAVDYAPPPAIRYIPVSILRQRMEAVGRWDEMSAILIGLMPTQPGLVLKLLTLEEGVDPADPQARALLVAAGADPDDILRPYP